MGLGINQELLPMKAHYYLFNAGTAPVVPFIPVLAKQLGYSASIIGLIYFVLPIVGMLAKPFFGVIADRFQRQKFLFLFFQLVVIVAFLGVLFVPTIPAKSELHCHGGITLIKFCPNKFDSIEQCTIEKLTVNPPNTTFECTMSCDVQSLLDNPLICGNWSVPGLCESSGRVNINTHIAHNEISVNDKCFDFVFFNATVNNHGTSLYCPGSDKLVMGCDLKCKDDLVSEVLSGATDDQVKSAYQFWLFFIFLTISWAGMAVVVSVGDAICFEMLGDKPQRYGHQRLWGSVGWGTFAIISGVLIDKFSEGQNTKNYAIGFYLMAAFIILDMFVSSKLQYSQTKITTTIISDVTQIMKSIRVAVFFLWLVAVGLGTAMVWNFLFWHLESLAGPDCNGGYMKTLEGFVMGIQCFGGELPFFFISGKLLKKIGHVHAMSLVLLGFGVRFFLYSILTNPWYVLPIELLNGVTFGVFYSTMASYASIVAPPGTEATMQGLAGAVFEGVGVSVGSLIGGHLIESSEGSWVAFRIFSYGAFIVFGIHLLVQWYINKTLGPHHGKNTTENVDGLDSNSSDALDVAKTAGAQEKTDDGLMNVDLTR